MAILVLVITAICQLIAAFGLECGTIRGSPSGPLRMKPHTFSPFLSIIGSMVILAATAAPGPQRVGAPSLSGNLENSVAIGDWIYYRARDDFLWQTDGTRLGSALVQKLAPEDAIGRDRNMLVAGASSLHAVAYIDERSDGILRFDTDSRGKIRSVRMLEDTVGLVASHLAMQPETGLLAFEGRHPERGSSELWFHDGQQSWVLENLFEIADAPRLPQGPKPRNISPYSHGRFLFTAIPDVSKGRGLFVSDGTEAGTFRVKTRDGQDFWYNRHAEVEGRYFFIGKVVGPDHDNGLWELTSDDALTAIRIPEEFSGENGHQTFPLSVVGIHDRALLLVANIGDQRFGLFSSHDPDQAPVLIGDFTDADFYHSLDANSKRVGAYTYFALHGHSQLFRTEGSVLDIWEPVVSTYSPARDLTSLQGNVVYGQYPGSTLIDYHTSRRVHIPDFGGPFSRTESSPNRLYGSSRSLSVLTPADIQPDLAAISGTWYDSDQPGQGLLLHPVDDQQLLVTYYGFDGSGEQLWLIGLYEGQKPMEGPIQIPMQVASGGGFGSFDPDDVNIQRWGNLELSFSTCRNGSALLSGPSGNMMLNLTQLAGVPGFECKGESDGEAQPSYIGLTGTWYDPETVGQGLFVHPAPEGRLIAAMFTFDQAGRQRWLIGSFDGPFNVEGPTTMDMFSATGTTFSNFDPDEVVVERWGFMTLEFSDCLNATAYLEGKDGAQTLSLANLTSVLGTGCEFAMGAMTSQER